MCIRDSREAAAALVGGDIPVGIAVFLLDGVDFLNLRSKIPQRHLFLQHLPGAGGQIGQIFNEADFFAVALGFPNGNIGIWVCLLYTSGLAHGGAYEAEKNRILSQYEQEAAACRQQGEDWQREYADKVKELKEQYGQE